MLNKSDVQWIVTPKIIGENVFFTVILSIMLLSLSIGTDLLNNLISYESVFLSLILVSFSVIYLFLILRAIKKHPDYVRKPRKTFHYAPKRSTETVLFFSLMFLIMIITVLFGIFTDTLVHSLFIAAIIFLIFVPLKSVFLYFWIRRLPF